ncbi:MAG: hypothetical protein BroJett029_27300 [Alphaproteobacteria bacterium]|nr:MAG: hypothetical protein BroJett029_27300 [Alphaproteobacteria bacterium]
MGNDLARRMSGDRKRAPAELTIVRRSPDNNPAAEPKWPRWKTWGVAVGSSLLLWAIIIAAILVVFT